MLAEVFLAPVAQPDPEDPRDLFLLRLVEAFVERERPRPLKPTGPVAVGVPVRPREADAAGRLLHEFGTVQLVVGLSLGGHVRISSTVSPTP